jgi:hypothetical protein
MSVPFLLRREKNNARKLEHRGKKLTTIPVKNGPAPLVI